MEADCYTLTSFFLPSVSYTTALGPTTALLRWLKADVSRQVKSQTREPPIWLLSQPTPRTFDEVVDCVVSEVPTGRLRHARPCHESLDDLLTAHAYIRRTYVGT